ncbi:hypothetical protein [Selenihalanaerobacter shriftii]|uniref:Inhibitor of sigma-G Gin n=1 Tax=Selenihalanaerobacter shriftii TaxID=142842 RepID=A0A1T4QQW4_9FIRM|nr:hypothetical protein [Selenihalanaerobacter shriftii]SKA06056.1 hypothetical protein SAMN02745118_02657 [Selenihalanaerobacter shriftii]
MFCIICDREIDENTFQNTCKNCEAKVDKMSKKILDSRELMRKKIDFWQLKSKEYNVS